MPDPGTKCGTVQSWEMEPLNPSSDGILQVTPGVCLSGQGRFSPQMPLKDQPCFLSGSRPQLSASESPGAVH